MGYLGSDYGFKATVLKLTVKAQDQEATEAILGKPRQDIAVVNDVDVQVCWVPGISKIEFTVSGCKMPIVLDRPAVQ